MQHAAGAGLSQPAAMIIGRAGDPCRPMKPAAASFCCAPRPHVEDGKTERTAHRRHRDPLSGEQGRDAGEDSPAERGEKGPCFAGMYDIRDESDRTGMRAVIELQEGLRP